MKTLKVKEMSCEHCVSRIGKLLTELNIAHEVHLEDKTVCIEDDTKVEQAIDELDDIGFTAQEM